MICLDITEVKKMNNFDERYDERHNEKANNVLIIRHKVSSISISTRISLNKLGI